MIIKEISPRVDCEILRRLRLINLVVAKVSIIYKPQNNFNHE